MRTRWTFVVLCLAGSAALVSPVHRAAAECVPPTVEHERGPFHRGVHVHVWGYGFGDDCYDTGSPPPGQGTLGKPLSDIDLVIRQNDREFVLATGDADDEYRFATDVDVPRDLEPGSASLIARRDGWPGSLFSGRISISSRRSFSNGPAELATFGPPSAADDGSAGDDGVGWPWVLAGVAIGAAGGAVAAMFATRRRRATV